MSYRSWCEQDADFNSVTSLAGRLQKIRESRTWLLLWLSLLSSSSFVKVRRSPINSSIISSAMNSTHVERFVSFQLLQHFVLTAILFFYAARKTARAVLVRSISVLCVSLQSLSDMEGTRLSRFWWNLTGSGTSVYKYMPKENIYFVPGMYCHLTLNWSHLAPVSARNSKTQFLLWPIVNFCWFF